MVIFRSSPQNSFDRFIAGHLRIHVQGNSVLRLAGKDKELQLRRDRTASKSLLGKAVRIHNGQPFTL